MQSPDREADRAHSGFTLIELLVVVAIIGVLSALALPRFMSSSAKTKQSEPRSILRQIYSLQRSYKSEYDTYACNGVTASSSSPNAFSALGFQLMGSARYSYAMVAGANTFTCTATANLDDDSTIDTWTIGNAGILTNTIDDVNN